jgi:hypothetical protein
MFGICAGTTMRDMRSAVKTSNWFAYTLLVKSRDSLVFSTFTSTDI